VRAAIEHALAQGLAVDGIKVLVVTGGADCASADEHPVLTSENLGELSGLRCAWGGRVGGWVLVDALAGVAER